MNRMVFGKRWKTLCETRSSSPRKMESTSLYFKILKAYLISNDHQKQKPSPQMWAYTYPSWDPSKVRKGFVSLSSPAAQTHKLSQISCVATVFLVSGRLLGWLQMWVASDSNDCWKCLEVFWVFVEYQSETSSLRLYDFGLNQWVNSNIFKRCSWSLRCQLCQRS